MRMVDTTKKYNLVYTEVVKKKLTINTREKIHPNEVSMFIMEAALIEGHKVKFKAPTDFYTPNGEITIESKDGREQWVFYPVAG